MAGSKLRLALALVPLVSAAACVNEDLRLYELELVGAITPADPALADLGALHVELHHAYIGEGQVRHPLGLVDAWQLETGERELEATTLVPMDGGAEGVVVYAWLDLDGDGILCSVDGDQDEPAGVLELSEYPAHSIEFELVLDQPCAGAERLFP